MSTCCVLIVDADELGRQRAANLLMEVGQSEGVQFEVHEAGDGGDALEIARKHPPDIVLMEVLIEGPNGLQVMRQLRKDKQPGEVPLVVLVTDMSAEIDRYWGLRSGAAAYVKKPWTPEQLRERVLAQLVQLKHSA